MKSFSKRKRTGVMLLAAAIPLCALAPAHVMAADDIALIDENFDGYAAEGENLIGKLVRTQDKQDKDRFPDELWSVNAAKWGGGNSPAEPAYFVHSPYGSADDYCAFFSTSTDSNDTAWDQLTYNVPSGTLQNDTLIFEGRIKNTHYYQNNADSGNLGNSFNISIGGRNANNENKVVNVLSIDSGITIGKNSKNWGVYNLPSDWVNFSMAVTLTGDDLSQCPAKLTLSGYTTKSQLYNPSSTPAFSTVVDLSDIGDVSRIDTIRYRGVIKKAEQAKQGDTIDTKRHGVYLDNARIIKAGDFKMSLDSDTDIEGNRVTVNFNHDVTPTLSGSEIPQPLGTESFTVTDPSGTAAAIESVDTSWIDMSSSTLTFADGALQPGTTYTITSTVTDVLGNTPAPVSFTTAAGKAPEASAVEPDNTVYTGTDGSKGYAYSFTVTPNDETVTKVTLTVKNGVNITSDAASLVKDNLNLSGAGSIKFGIFASTFGDGENPTFSVTLN